MKKITPIKRSPALVALSKDHHFGLLLVWKIRTGINKGISPERISNYVLYFFKEDLKNHFLEEEQLIFTKLPVDDKLRLQAETEHQTIYSLINKVEQDKHDIAHLNQFAETLNDHIRFEERVLFNHIQEILTPEQIEDILIHTARRGPDCDTTWTDKFWQ